MRKPETQALGISGEEASLLCLSHGISSYGVQERACERSGSGEGGELTFGKHCGLCCDCCYALPP